MFSVLFQIISFKQKFQNTYYFKKSRIILIYISLEGRKIQRNLPLSLSLLSNVKRVRYLWPSQKTSTLLA